MPVLEDGKLVGVVTDRDICIALATRDERASEIIVGEVVRTPVHTCGPDDDVHVALATMKQHRVRRLPVEGFGGFAINWTAAQFQVESTNAAQTAALPF